MKRRWFFKTLLTPFVVAATTVLVSKNRIKEFRFKTISHYKNGSYFEGKERSYTKPEVVAFLAQDKNWNKWQYCTGPSIIDPEGRLYRYKSVITKIIYA